MHVQFYTIKKIKNMNIVYDKNIAKLTFFHKEMEITKPTIISNNYIFKNI